MFVGHALLAFAVAALVADWRGWSTGRALTVGVVAGAFAAIPDLDVVYALGALEPGTIDGVDGALAASNAFWGASTEVHRSMTHSLVVALVAGPAVALWASQPAERLGGRPSAGKIVGAAALVGLVAVAIATSGALGGVVMGLFAFAGASIATAARVRTDFAPRTIALAATFGLLSHPWGDLLTGMPPRMLYPLSGRLIEARLVLHPDPTLHLLGAFAVELAVIWFATIVFTRVTDRSCRRLIGKRAAVGGVYGATAVLLTPPTLAVSYHFVFSIVAVGVLCGITPTRPLPVPAGARPLSKPDPDAAARVVLTTLAAITVALVGYALVYATVVAPS